MQRKRAGFTLIELLTVIAIIGVLMSLLIVGVSAAFRQMNLTRARNDIGQISMGVQSFYKKFGFYPPDQIRLCSSKATYGATALDKASINTILRMFKNINWNNIKWDGATKTLDVTLEGDQALVFFLGGIPSNGLPQGFSTNPTDPSDMTVTNRYGPYFQFNTAQLQKLTAGRSAGASAAASAGFLSYIDAWNQQPYLYFSGNNRPNGYTSSFTFGSVTVAPYIQSANNFLNADTFQLLSAGPDTTFGPGSTGGIAWTPKTGATYAASFPTAADDLSNFSDTALGVNQ